MKIKYEAELESRLVDKILLILFNNQKEEPTFLELTELLGDEYKSNSNNWKKLKLHLMYMEDQKLIEERHFGVNGGDQNRTVDYSLEKAGIDHARKLLNI